LSIAGKAGQPLHAPELNLAISGSFLISLTERMPFACANRLGYFADIRSDGEGRLAQSQTAVDLSFEPNTLR
jgi:hypothetical protein